MATQSRATPRTSKASTTKGRLPAGKQVDFDLDALEITADDPYFFRARGDVFRAINVKDLDWQVAATLSGDRIFTFFENVIHPEDQDRFLALKLTGKELEAIFAAYREHFELFAGPLGEGRA